MIRRVAALAVLAGSLSAAVPSLAQDAREAQMVGFRDLCNHNDRKACVKFGMMLQQNADRQAAWRRTHPDWFFWEN